jgi:hypothetical protein
LCLATCTYESETNIGLRAHFHALAGVRKLEVLFLRGRALLARKVGDEHVRKLAEN